MQDNEPWKNDALGNVQPEGLSSPMNQPQLPHPPLGRPPVPSHLRRDHNIPGGEQHAVAPENLPKGTNNLFTNDQPNVESSTSEYDFILNPAKPAKPIIPLAPILNGKNKFSRIFIILGLIFIIIIFLAVVLNLTKGTSNDAALVSVAADQSALLNVINNANSSTTAVPASDQNILATSALALKSSSSQLLAYMSANDLKITTLQLNSKISSAANTEIATSQSSGNYSQTLNAVLISQFNTYQSDLRYANSLTKGIHGRALLSSDYNQAKLILGQLQ